MSTKIQVRRGTAAQWTAANPTLAEGEIGFETDTGKFKVGGVKNITQTVVTGGTNVVYTTAVAHGLAALDYVNISGITTAQGLPVTNPVQITAITSTTFTVAVTTGTTGTYTSLSGTATSPWNSLLYLTDTSDFVGILAGANGGTGVANTGKTITLGGNLTTSGAFATTLTATATTALTLPTTGTLATLAGSEALTNKSYNGLTLTNSTTGFSLAGGSVTSKTLQVNNTLTLAGTDATTTTLPPFTTTVPSMDFWYSGTTNISANTSANSLFGLTNGVALAATSVYALEMYVAFASAEVATSHTVSLGFAYSGTLNSIGYGLLHQYNTTSYAAQAPTGGFMAWITTNAATAISPAITSAATYYHIIRVNGIVRTTTAGNFNPTITFSVANNATFSTQSASYIKLKTLNSASANASSFGTWS